MPGWPLIEEIIVMFPSLDVNLYCVSGGTNDENFECGPELNFVRFAEQKKFLPAWE